MGSVHPGLRTGLRIKILVGVIVLTALATSVFLNPIRVSYSAKAPTESIAYDEQISIPKIAGGPERQGVCRDFAHLAITFCRCLNIPARYSTGYLGDIGIPPVDAPMDFVGAMEVYLGGAWHTFDPRNNARRIGRICVAHGRDAADVAISTAFGGVSLQSFRVWTDELSESDAAAWLARGSRQTIPYWRAA